MRSAADSIDEMSSNRCTASRNGASALKSRGAPLTVLDIPDAAPRDIYGFDLILLRPDMHIVWRGNTGPADAAVLAATATGH